MSPAPSRRQTQLATRGLARTAIRSVDECTPAAWPPDLHFLRLTFTGGTDCESQSVHPQNSRGPRGKVQKSLKSVFF